MKYESTILKRLIDTYGVVGNPRYISEIIKEFIVRGKECFPNLFTYQADWLAHIDEFGLKPTYTVSYTGQSIYAPNTLERPVKSAILKGNTLVNTFICEHTLPLSGATISDNTITLDKSQQWSRIELLPSNSLWIPNEKYTTILYDVVGDTSTLNMCSKSGNTTNTKTPFTNNKAVFIMGTKEINKNNRLGYIESTTIVGNETVSFKVSILKGDYSDVDVPYFEGMQSVQMPVLMTTGKNLFNWEKFTWHMNRSQWSHGNGGLGNKNAIGYQGTTGTISDFNLQNGKTYFTNATISFYADDTFDQALSGTRTNTFIVPNNAQYVAISKKISNEAITKITNPEIILAEGSTPTTYEPYKTNILTVNEDVTLRSNGSVCDELDLLTGKLTQRIDEDGEILTQEVVKTVDLTILDQNGQNVKQLMSFNGGTHFTTTSLESSPLPVVSVSVETDLEETLKVCSLEGNTM